MADIKHKIYIFLDSKVWDKLKSLKDKCDILSAKLDYLISGEIGDRRICESYTSRIWFENSGYQIEEGRFSGTTRSHDGDK